MVVFPFVVDVSPFFFPFLRPFLWCFAGRFLAVVRLLVGLSLILGIVFLQLCSDVGCVVGFAPAMDSLPPSISPGADARA